MNRSVQKLLPDEAREVLEFWYGELNPEQWWERDDAVDEVIISRFAGLYERLAGEVPGAWLQIPKGRLAAVIVLDQFPRNIFRGSARAFESDAKALRISSDTIAAGDDEVLSQVERSFLYMPFQHCEDCEIQARSVALFQSLGDASQLDFAIKHKQIIDRFNRFPHRNEVLDRDSSPREKEFLGKPGLFW